MEFVMSEASLEHMSHKSIHISIPKPCHESWDRMDATERGAFCHSCQKEVIDFSRMTDEQVISYLANTTNTCGRFREDQVKRQLRLYRPANGFLRWRVYALGLLPLLAYGCNTQQGNSDRRHTWSSDYITTGKVKITSDAMPELPPPDTIYLAGRVLNEDHKPLVHATVSIIDTVTRQPYESTTTDSTGQYSLPIRVKDHDRHRQVLMASHPEYRPETAGFTQAMNQYREIALYRPERALMGDVEVTRSK